MPAGDSFTKNLVVLGAPEPTFTLEKLNTGSGLYDVVTDARVELNNTTLSISDLRVSDSGDFRIVTENTEGVSYREFIISVIGEYNNSVQNV